MESLGSFVLAADSCAGGSHKNNLVNWEVRDSPSFVTNGSMLTSRLPVNSSQALVDLGFQDAPMKQVFWDSIPDALRGRISGGRDGNGSVRPSVAPANGFHFEGEHPSLNPSGSLVDPSPVIDLKLGQLSDQRDGRNLGLSRGAPMLSLSESSPPAKRCRASGFSSQAAYCQVYGCDKDLSSSKEYHKRHKVCGDHSKAPRVIVSGIEQRFCQQCSRFHLLCEFDDGKRSCRKRLAGHNERRRKPHVGFHPSGRAARFLLPCDVVKFHEMDDWVGHIKLEATTNCSPLPLSSFQYRELHPRPPFSSPSIEKDLCSFQEINRDSSTVLAMFENNSPNPGPGALLNKDLSLGTEEFGTVFATESHIQGFSGISEPGCARSLLSSQSHNSPSHTSGIHMDHSLSQYTMAQVSDNRVADGGSNRFLVSLEGSQAGPALVSDSDSAGFEISDETLRGSVFSNAKGPPTIDLLQLSSKLQQVEHERQYMKLEFDSSACLRTTY